MNAVILGNKPLKVADVVAVAQGARAELDLTASQRLDAVAGLDLQPRLLEEKERHITEEGPPDDNDPDALTSPEEQIEHFLLSHCAGVGPPLPDDVVRALMLCRANVFVAGHSGVRPALVEALLGMLNDGITPVVPSQGSVGAAGDLAPLAHVARVLAGLGGAVHRREPDAPLRPFFPNQKETLSLINGATLTTALGALAVHRATRVLRALEVACAMSMEALRADQRCLSHAALSARHHPGGVATAQRLRDLLHDSHLCVNGEPDAFSLRAAPAVIGAAWDALGHTEAVVERELNGACDNPLWLDGAVVEAGNFHGAPVAVVLDYLRIALTQALTQSERRSFRLTCDAITQDLPPFLIANSGLNSGFMIAQYTAASLASECKGLSHPASVDTIPTLQHYEDHVSMGPIAGRLTLRVLEAAADIVAIEALLAAQALDYRRRGLSFTRKGREVVQVEGTPVALAPAIAEKLSLIRQDVPFWESDGVMHPAIAAVGRLVRSGALGSDNSGELGW